MTDFDINAAEDQRGTSLVPPGVYRLRNKIRPGGHGSHDLFKLAKSQKTFSLDIESTVVGGEYDGRRVWQLVTVGCNVRPDDPEHEDERQLERYRTAVRIGLSRLKSMVNSALGLLPSDTSEAARKARSAGDNAKYFDGLEYYAVVDVQPARGEFKPRNEIVKIITADMPEWPGGPPPRKPIGEEMNDEIPF